MRRGLTLVVVLGALVLPGCITEKGTTSTSFLRRGRPLQGPEGRDVVQIDMALLERPIDDAFLSQEFWQSVDEQIVNLERKGVLEENGFRIGQMGGIPPARLQSLLRAEQGSANSSQRYMMRSGHPMDAPLGPVIANCRFQLATESGLQSVHLTQATALLQIEPSPLASGNVRLKFTPRFIHGDHRLTPKAVEDGSGFLLQAQRPDETYTALSWEVPLAPNQLLVIGPRTDRPQSLGYQCFVRRDESLPVQRILLIRIWSAVVPEGDDPGEGSGDAEPHPVPVALQASWATGEAAEPSR